jgi:hypothetical protein
MFTGLGEEFSSHYVTHLLPPPPIRVLHTLDGDNRMRFLLCNVKSNFHDGRFCSIASTRWL